MELDLQDHLRDQRLVPTHGVHYRAYKRRAHLLGLYSEGYKAFTDITEGISRGCNTTGFPATKGWDAVTGFGTPIFPELVRIAKECA
jgi:hypothetical protein